MTSLRKNIPMLAALATGILSSAAHADNLHLGGAMKHVLVFLYDDAISIEIEDGLPDERVELIRYPGETYDGDASILNEQAYSGRYGWLAGHFITLPDGASIWVESLRQTKGLSTYDALSFDPIFGTSSSSSLWEWNGTMVHNWYVGSRLGFYDATYRIYVGDQTGAPIPSFTPGEITLHWNDGFGALASAWSNSAAVGSPAFNADARRANPTGIPTPGAAAILGLSIALWRRR